MASPDVLNSILQRLEALETQGFSVSGDTDDLVTSVSELTRAAQAQQPAVVPIIPKPTATASTTSASTGIITFIAPITPAGFPLGHTGTTASTQVMLPSTVPSSATLLFCTITFDQSSPTVAPGVFYVSTLTGSQQYPIAQSADPVPGNQANSSQTYQVFIPFDQPSRSFWYAVSGGTGRCFESFTISVIGYVN